MTEVRKIQVAYLIECMYQSVFKNHESTCYSCWVASRFVGRAEGNMGYVLVREFISANPSIVPAWYLVD